MDESVIEINDSIISISTDTDMEDVEVKEADDSSSDIIEITAKPASPPPPPQSTLSKHAKQIQQMPSEKTVKQKTSTTDPELIFEVNFCSTDDFSKFSNRMLEVFNKTFAEDKLVFKTNEPESRISAYIKPATPQPDIDLFQIDTAPATKLNASQVPSYKRCHPDILDEETSNRKKLKAEAVNKCFRPKMQSACFNCGDTDHSLRECTRPRNQNRIQQARRKTSRVDRNHVDAEQRFAHIRPGKISSKTRHAMGFSRGELPFMFYRMRVLGYPPAWLEEAKVQSSGMAQFNADGSEVQGPEEEEGKADSFKYDVNKIIDFPGFNVDPGAKFYDDYQHHNVPRFQENQLKTNFIKSLGENVTKGYKRNKLIDLPTPHDVKLAAVERATNLVEHDMDVEDGNSMDSEQPPPLPAESDAPAPPPPPTEEDISVGSFSPSLEDLKAQQAELLQQLESNTSLSTSNEQPPPLPAESDAPAPPPPPTEEDISVGSFSPSLEDLKAQQAELLQQLESNTSLSTSNEQPPPLPAESDAPAPPPPPTKEDISVGSFSPSLEDLKAQKAELLQQLESNTSLSTSNEQPPPLPAESDAPAPPPPPTEEDISVGSFSPSLEDLKAQKAELLQQLESNSSLNTSNLSVAKSNVLSVQSPTHDDDDDEAHNAPAPPPDPAEVANAVVFKGPSIEGTPLLKFSVYEKLPVGDNFKKGVSDVINFENLPDSTGKYEKMKDLLKKVRVQMDKLQNSDD